MFMTLSSFFFNPKTQSDDGPLGGKQCPHNKTEEAVFPKLLRLVVQSSLDTGSAGT